MFPHMVVAALLSCVTPIGAQNIGSSSSSISSSLKSPGNEDSQNPASADPGPFNDFYEVASLKKALGELPDGKPAFVTQDALTLNSKEATRSSVEAVANLDVLRNPSPYRRVMVSTEGKMPYEVSTNGLETGLAMISAVYRKTGKTEALSDCTSIALSIEQSIKLDQASVLELVEREVSANPGCACEIVKTALKTTEADVELVTSIVETAINASPENMRIISQCAIASVPESITAVQALLAKLDPNSGDEGSSSKSAKSSKDSTDSEDTKNAKVASVVSIMPNPLDIPLLPPQSPPPSFPPQVTNVNPTPLPSYPCL